MNIAQAIMHLFPQVNPMIDFIVQDDSDGEGPYIAHWGLEEPEPTEEELQAAWDDFESLPVLEPLETEAEKIIRLESSLAISNERLDAAEGAILALMDMNL